MASWLEAELFIPENDPPNKQWYEEQGGGTLRLPKCNGCGMFSYPPRTYCSDCRGEEFTYEDLSGKGTIHSYLVLSEPIHPAFRPHPNAVIALVELDEQKGMNVGGDRSKQPAEDRALRIICNIVKDDGSFEDPSNIAINKRVEVKIIDLGDGMGLPQWKISGEASDGDEWQVAWE